MFTQAIFFSTDDATSSEASAAGKSRSNSRAGRKTSPSGPGPVPVNRFRVPANAPARRTNGTSGRNSTASSASAGLQQSLESRLRAMTDLNGSMEYLLTWKNSVTPSGRVICRLRASARRTSDSDSSGWLNGWPTPASQNADAGPNPRGNVGERFTLQTAAGLAGWSTPDASAINDGESLESFEARRAKLKAKGINGNGAGMPLAISAQLAGWPTPDSSHHGNIGPEKALLRMARKGAEKQATNLDDVAALTPGPTSGSSPVSTASRGVLDAAFSRWLMAFPPAHDPCSPNWSNWALIQGLLVQHSGASPEFWRALAATVLVDSGASATRSLW